MTTNSATPELEDAIRQCLSLPDHEWSNEAERILTLLQAREQQLLDSLYEPRDDCSVAETVLVNLQEALEERKKA